MEKINYKEILLNSYLCICDSTSGLKEIGYAKLLFFVLFLENKEVSRSDIKKTVANYVGIKGIPDESLQNALNLLKSRKLVFEEDGKFALLPNERIKTEKQIKYSMEVSKKICGKHFPKSINQEELEKWFDETNEQYFSAFADKLIELYSKKRSLLLEVEKILLPVIHKYKLDFYKDELIQGYREFLLSSDREEEEKIWNLMQYCYLRR